MKGKVKMICSMLVFGSIGIFVKNIDLPSMEIAFLRAAIASIVLVISGIWMWKSDSWKGIKDNLLYLIISGAAIGFNWILLFQAYKYTTIPNATLSYYFAPVFVVALSPIFLKEKISVKKILCIVVAMAGLFLIILSNGQSDQGVNYNHIKGILLGLSGAALYASIIIMNKHIKNLSGYETTLVQLFVSAMVLLPFILYRGNIHINQLSNLSIIMIVILGVLHTGVAYLLYFSGIKDISGQSIAILSYIDPISAVIFSAIFLGEAMNGIQIFGGILILGSTFLCERFD